MVQERARSLLKTSPRSWYSRGTADGGAKVNGDLERPIAGRMSDKRNSSWLSSLLTNLCGCCASSAMSVPTQMATHGRNELHLDVLMVGAQARVWRAGCDTMWLGLGDRD